MRLTPAGKFLLFVVGLAVLGYAGWTYRNQLPQMPRTSTTTSTPASTPEQPAAPTAERKGVLGRIRETGIAAQ